MESNRIKLEVYAHLPELTEYVKSTAICREIGVTPAWLNGKLHRNVNTKYSIRKFSEDDVRRLNEGVWSVASRLMDTTIDYSEDRQLVIDQIKGKYACLFLKSIAVKKMGWTESKFKSCMVNSSANGNFMKFSKQDVQQFVLAVREVAVRMLSVEYYVES